MSDRSYRLFFGLTLLLALYFRVDYIVHGLIVLALLEGLTNTEATSFKEVALIRYARPDVYALCFVSRRLEIEVDGKRVPHTTCFVPSTPTPVSGMVVMVPSDEVLAVDMTVEEGLKFLVSGGVASPDNIKTRGMIGNSTCEESSNEAG